MKKHNLINNIVAVVLASLIALSGIGCLSSAFQLSVRDHVHLVCICVFFTFLCTLCFRFRWGSLLLTGLLLLAAVVLLPKSDLLLSAEYVVYHITRIYNNAYGCGYIRWSEEALTSVSADAALTALACLIAMAVCWSISRRKWATLAVALGILPLALCCIVTDTEPAIAFLWPLLSAMILLLLTQRLRRIRAEDANRLIAWCLVPVIVFSSTIFRLSQRNGWQTHTQKFNQQITEFLSQLSQYLPDGSIQVSGPTLPLSTHLVALERVDLTAGPSADTNEPLMYVTSPVSGTIYLRGQAYDTYTGVGWTNAYSETSDAGWPVSGLFSRGTVHISTTGRSQLYYTPYYISDYADMTTKLLPNYEMQTEYTFPLMQTGRNTRVEFTPLSDRQQAACLQLPDETRAAAEEILAMLMYDFVDYDTQRITEIVSKYVRLSAKYDLNTPAMPEGETDFALWFLTSDTTGYCVHFASAAVVLLRAAGVPARYVTGYMVDATASEMTAVLDSQAHAWVEYLDPLQGWTVLEVTPAAGSSVDPDPTEPTTEASTGPTTLPTVPTPSTEPSTEPSSEPTVPTTQPTETAPSTTPSTQPTETAPSTAPSTQVSTPATEPTQQPQEKIQLNLTWIRNILYLLLLWAVLAGQYKLRIYLRKRRLSSGDSNRRARKHWRYACHLARISGYSAAELLPLAEKATFSQHTLTEEELELFRQWQRRAGESLLKKNWLWQLVLRLIFAIE